MMCSAAGIPVLAFHCHSKGMPLTSAPLARRNFLDVVSYVAQMVITVMHLGRLHLSSNFLSVIMALQVLVLWVKVQYFARCVLQPLSLICVLLPTNVAYRLQT